MTTVCTGNARYAVTRIYAGLETSHYRNLDDLLLDILTSNGKEVFERFKTKILPQAQKAWDDDDEAERRKEKGDSEE